MGDDANGLLRSEVARPNLDAVGERPAGAQHAAPNAFSLWTPAIDEALVAGTTARYVTERG